MISDFERLKELLNDFGVGFNESKDGRTIAYSSGMHNKVSANSEPSLTVFFFDAHGKFREIEVST